MDWGNSLGFQSHREAWLHAYPRGSKASNIASDFTTPTQIESSKSRTSPKAKQNQRCTSLRLSTQFQPILDASPLSSATLRQRRQKKQDRRWRDLREACENSSAPDTPERLDEKEQTRLDALSQGELVWGPHADFEVCEKADPWPSPEQEQTLTQNPNGHIQYLPTNIKLPIDGETEPVVPSKLPQTPRSRSRSRSHINQQYRFPSIEMQDPSRKLSKWELIRQRSLFALVILCLNTACLVAALKSHRHLWILILILFVKAKDILSTIGALFWIIATSIPHEVSKAKYIPPKWILTCVTAYAETEAQIMRTISNIIEHEPTPHKKVLCVILDGIPQNIQSCFTRTGKVFRRPYQTWKLAHGEVKIYTGHIGQIPVLLFEKIKNAGKKDSLILCHDLFDVMRDNVPAYTKALRQEVWNDILPLLLGHMPEKFDYIFCTDADSLIHKGALQKLVSALAENPNAIGACGLVLAEMLKGNEWSIWYLYQQFQYTFGQFVRRRAEGMWGRVTCLPGCVTMIAVRDEMAGAIKQYAEPVTDRLVFKHQVQYLGTDRRLTYCILSQGKHLRTLFVPQAVSETVAPQDFPHYMSQRRRWGSNAYFNSYFYFSGSGHWVITRLWASMDIARQTLVYYRVANTVMFIYGLTRHFAPIKLVPYFVVTQTPTLWFFLVVLLREPILRRQAHKLVLGWIINRLISPILAILIFSNVILHLGSAVWGRTGASTEATSALDFLHTITPKASWTPIHIARLVRDTIREHTRKDGEEIQLPTPQAIEEGLIKYK